MEAQVAAPGDPMFHPPTRLLGASDAIQDVQRLIRRAARVEATILISGESGVGKELVAREIHGRSSRRDAPFVPLNCAAIPDSLIETELFGHEAGAFTDARSQRRGAFELADRGTLFLDEVGDLSPAAQPKLLRALESGEVSRLGGERAFRVDMRVISASNRDLRSMYADGLFRSDLYYRLCVLEIHVPPLRDRIEDIPVLARSFARDLAQRTGHGEVEFDPASIELLQSHSWPGNVRELKHVVERAMVFGTGRLLRPDCFELHGAAMPVTLSGLLRADWRSAREGFEAAYARRLLERHDGSVRRAARDAGLAPGSMYKMLRRLGLRPGPDRS